MEIIKEGLSYKELKQKRKAVKRFKCDYCGCVFDAEKDEYECKQYNHKELNPKYFFIENPRGGMRKMAWMQDIPRYTVTYCKYGETRMKPTDIWTNHPMPMFKPACKNGDTCHVAAPRGSQTGTQGIKGSKDRSRIPRLLCEHIVDICEMRTCAICGKPMLDGFCIRDGMEYFCSDECLHKVYAEEEYQELYDSDQAYWTTWYDEFE